METYSAETGLAPVPSFPLVRSRYGTRRMDIFGSEAATPGGRAATGSSRYSFRSSSLIGTDAQKYENVLLSGIISLRNRSANWRTLSLERSTWAGIQCCSHSSPRSTSVSQLQPPRDHDGNIIGGRSALREGVHRAMHLLNDFSRRTFPHGSD